MLFKSKLKRRTRKKRKKSRRWLIKRGKKRGGS
jgi:hypothetical protein